MSGDLGVPLTTLDYPRPEAPRPSTADWVYPATASQATVTLDGAAVKAFAGIAIPQAVTHDPATGHALIAYYTPGDYPRPAVAEVTADGTVVSQAELTDGDGGDSLDLYRIGTIDDTHNTLEITLDKKGYVHVAGNMRPHRPMGYWRSTLPHTVGSMLYKSQLPGLAYNANDVSLFATGAERVASYPSFFRAADDELYFGFRHYKSGQGNFYLLHYDADTSTWDNPSGGNDTTYGFVDQNVPLLDGYNDSMSPYVQPIVVGPDGWYWLTWSWRDDVLNADTESRIQVMKTTDFRSWFSASGTALPSSIVYSWQDTGTNVPTDLQVGALPKAGAGFVNNQNQLGFAADGTPVMVYFMAQNGKTVIRVDKLGSRGSWVGGTPVPLSGFYDVAAGVSGSILAIDGPPLAVQGSTDVIVRYTVNGVGLQVRAGLGARNTYSKTIEYDYQRLSSLPVAATESYPESEGYSVTARAAISDPFTTPDGSTRVWAIKWDAGPYVSNGKRASWAHPVDGSALTLHSYTPVG